MAKAAREDGEVAKTLWVVCACDQLSGGIQVWEGRGDDSPINPEPLGTGSVIIQKGALAGKLLHFQRLTGWGANTGWCPTDYEGLEVVVKLPSGLERESLWVVVGGADKGGILVREGKDTNSKQKADRLSRSALVKEKEYHKGRISYEKIAGKGPSSGWVSLKLQEKDLLVKVSTPVELPELVLNASLFCVNMTATERWGFGSSDTSEPVKLDQLYKLLLCDRRLKCVAQTIEENIESMSQDGDVEFRAFIRPGVGFHVYGGFWVPEELPGYAPGAAPCSRSTFLEDSLIIFIAGFNDGLSAHIPEMVYRCLVQHVQWYKQFKGSKLAFIEIKDSKGNECPWMTRYLHALAKADKDVVVEELVFPENGWASEHYLEDSAHLAKSGLRRWLPDVKRFALDLASKAGKKKVMFVADSTFEAHDYRLTVWPGCGGFVRDIHLTVTVATLGGRTMKFTIDEDYSVQELKEAMALKGFPQPNIEPDNMILFLPSCGQKLEEWKSLSLYYVDDGTLLFVTCRRLAVYDQSPPGEFFTLEPPEVVPMAGSGSLLRCVCSEDPGAPVYEAKKPWKVVGHIPPAGLVTMSGMLELHDKVVFAAISGPEGLQGMVKLRHGMVQPADVCVTCLVAGAPPGDPALEGPLRRAVQSLWLRHLDGLGVRSVTVALTPSSDGLCVEAWLRAPVGWEQRLRARAAELKPEAAAAALREVVVGGAAAISVSITSVEVVAQADHDGLDPLDAASPKRVTYHGAGGHPDSWMPLPVDAFASCGYRCGVFSTPDPDLAFQYSLPMEGRGTKYKVAMQSAVRTEHLSKHHHPRGEFWIVPDMDDMEFSGFLVALDIDAADQIEAKAADAPAWQRSQDPSWHAMVPDFSTTNAIYLAPGTARERKLFSVFCKDETAGLYPHAEALAKKHVMATSYKEGRDKVVELAVMLHPATALGIMSGVMDFVTVTAVGGPNDGLQAVGFGGDADRRTKAAKLALAATAREKRLPDIAEGARLEAAGAGLDLAFHAFAERAWKILRDPAPEPVLGERRSGAAAPDPAGRPKAAAGPRPPPPARGADPQAAASTARVGSGPKPGAKAATPTRV